MIVSNDDVIIISFAQILQMRFGCSRRHQHYHIFAVISTAKQVQVTANTPAVDYNAISGMFISDKELLGVKNCCFTASGIFFTKDHKNPDWSNDLNNVKYSFPAMNDESVNSGNNYNYALAA